MTLFEQKILDHLVDEEVVKEDKAEDVQKELDSADTTLEEHLVKKLKVSSDDLLEAKSEASQVKKGNYNPEKPPSEKVLKVIPQDAVTQYKMVPLKKKGDKVVVGMVDPTNIKSQQALQFTLLRSELEPEVVVITEEDFNKLVALYKKMNEEVETALEEIEEVAQEEEEEAGSAAGQGVSATLKETPVTKIVSVILKNALEGGASDIHIEPMRSNTKVRFRVDGVLHSSLMLPVAVHSSIVARIKILSSLRLDESRIPQDGRFNTQLNKQMIDFRVSTLPTNLGEKVVMRLLNPEAATLEFKELGLVGRNKKLFDQALEEPFGIILISGPTGSGKTTTLYTGLNKVNTEGVNVTTLEDPIEYNVEGVAQSQIRPEIDYTFATGLRTLMRQDPDIIMVGEIRDGETAELATQAALTGHLVFSTIHTNNAIGIIPRLLDLGVEPFLLPSALNLAVAQRLVGRLCKKCKKEKEVLPKVEKMIDEELENVPQEELEIHKIKKPYKLWDAEGCSSCGNKKTKGRIAIYEMLKMTKKLEKAIIENPSNTAFKKEADRQNMITMKQDGLIKALQGIISLEELMKVIEDK